MTVYDTIIIGAGPSGITAAIYAARKKSSFLLITKDIGGQTLWSGSVENYTGWQFITGPELVNRFEDHLKQFDIKINEEEVKSARADGGFIEIETDKASYKSRTAVVASGTKSKELNIPGEEEFKNRGVQYCATCDAPLFAGRDVAVIGGGNSALEAAIQLAGIAESVIMVNNTGSIHGDPVMLDRAVESKKISIRNDASITMIEGGAFVTGIRIASGKAEELVPVQGVFVEIGLEPNSDFLQGVKKNAKGEIEVNCLNETSTPGIFAAGDVTNVPEKQIIIAAGEGAKASLSAYRYVIRNAA